MNGRRRPRETCEVEVLCSGTVYRLISRACVAGTPSGGCAGTPERVLPHAPEHGLQPVRRRACAPEHVGGARALGLRGRGRGLLLRQRRRGRRRGDRIVAVPSVSFGESFVGLRAAAVTLAASTAPGCRATLVRPSRNGLSSRGVSMFNKNVYFEQ